jgi:acetylornithine deacetylase/succinyl-diaminopimelate desuccinylase-like protein
MPGSAEKGYVDVFVTIDMAGGHSSMTPDYATSKYHVLF